MSRYNEFRLELLEDHVSLAEAEDHVSALEREIEKQRNKSSAGLNLRLSYALDELEATLDHIADIKKHMALEEREAR